MVASFSSLHFGDVVITACMQGVSENDKRNNLKRLLRDLGPTLYPLMAASMATAAPVLPLLAATTVPPGRSWPEDSAWSFILYCYVMLYCIVLN